MKLFTLFLLALIFIYAVAALYCTTHHESANALLGKAINAMLRKTPFVWSAKF